MSLFDLKLQRRVSIPLQLFSGYCDANPEPLHVAEILNCFSKMSIPIVRNTRPAKIFSINLSERPAWVLYFDAITKPGYPHGRICTFIAAMHNRISGQLLQSCNGIVRTAVSNMLPVIFVAIEMLAWIVSSRLRSISGRGPEISLWLRMASVSSVPSILKN